MKRAKRAVFLVVCVPLLWLCSCTTNVQNERAFKLPSGRVVRVQGAMPITFSQGPPALMLKYETDLKISDMAALRQEVNEVWNVFVADVERGHFQSAIISVNEKPTGFILKRSNSFNFVYEKRADGQWHSVNEEKPQ